MIDFYMDNDTDIPIHMGFCHILPLTFQQTIGTIAVPITNMKQEPIGKIASNSLKHEWNDFTKNSCQGFEYYFC